MSEAADYIVIYNYDRLTGAFVSEGKAHESPMEPGVFMDPAFSTRHTPPSAPAGHYAAFNRDADAWAVKPIPTIEDARAAATV